MGSLSITKKQANRLGLEPYQRRSPLLERCCLILAANSSYQNGENDLKILTGISVSHSSLQRKVQRHSVDFPDVKQKLTEVSLDGGKVRIRSEKGGNCYWKEYKTARLQGIYYGAFFQESALNLLEALKPSVGEKFVKHLTKHRQRLINYQEVQLQQMSSIGSGAVESAVKQISQRLQLTGAQWKWDSVPQILRLRCAYLNGQLASALNKINTLALNQARSQSAKLRF